MAHARIGIYRVKPGMTDEVVRRAESGMLPAFRQQPGFREYSLIRTGEEELVSLSWWDSKTQADAAVPIAAAWVKENISTMVTLLENHVGESAFTGRR